MAVVVGDAGEAASHSLGRGLRRWGVLGLALGVAMLALSAGAVAGLQRGMLLQAGFLQVGPGATLRTGESKLRDVVSVKDFGAVGDCATDNAPAFALALAAGKLVLVPDPSGACYAIKSTLTIPANTRLVGSSYVSTKLQLQANVDLISLGDGAQLSNLWLDGNAVGGFTGRGVLASSGCADA